MLLVCIVFRDGTRDCCYERAPQRAPQRPAARATAAPSPHGMVKPLPLEKKILASDPKQ